MTKTITLTDDGVEMIIESLSIRRNIIETGCPTLGAIDIEHVGDEYAKRHNAKIRALSADQMQLIIQIDELCKELIKR